MQVSAALQLADQSRRDLDEERRKHRLTSNELADARRLVEVFRAKGTEAGKLRAEVARLEQQVGRKDVSVDSLKSHMQQRDCELTNMRAELQKARETHDDAVKVSKSSQSALRAKIRKLEKLLAAKRTDVQKERDESKFAKQVQKLKDELEKEKAERSQTKNKYREKAKNALKTTFDNLKLITRDKNVLTHKLNYAQTRNAELEKSCADFASQMKSLRQKVEAFQNVIRTLPSDISARFPEIGKPAPALRPKPQKEECHIETDLDKFLDAEFSVPTLNSAFMSPRSLPPVPETSVPSTSYTESASSASYSNASPAQISNQVLSTPSSGPMSTLLLPSSKSDRTMSDQMISTGTLSDTRIYEHGYPSRVSEPSLSRSHSRPPDHPHMQTLQVAHSQPLGQSPIQPLHDSHLQPRGHPHIQPLQGPHSQPRDLPPIQPRTLHGSHSRPLDHPPTQQRQGSDSLSLDHPDMQRLSRSKSRQLSRATILPLSPRPGTFVESHKRSCSQMSSYSEFAGDKRRKIDELPRLIDNSSQPPQTMGDPVEDHLPEIRISHFPKVYNSWKPSEFSKRKIKMTPKAFEEFLRGVTNENFGSASVELSEYLGLSRGPSGIADCFIQAVFEPLDVRISRFPLSPLFYNYMVAEFTKNASPSVDELTQLSHHIGRPLGDVREWFAIARAKGIPDWRPEAGLSMVDGERTALVVALLVKFSERFHEHRPVSSRSTSILQSFLNRIERKLLSSPPNGDDWLAWT
eukprot:247642_1